jgi:hypothetical protein
MRYALAFLAASLAFGPLATFAPAVELVKDGKPSATIVVRDSALKAKPYTPAPGVAADPDAKVHLAALDLQKYVQKISGAVLPLVAASQPTQGAVVLVGASKRTSKLDLKIPAGITRERVEEGYLLAARGDALVLAGNDEGPYNGTYFAVAEFLHRQGVRWYMPSDFGEIVPEKRDVALADIEFRDKPSFRIRSWWGHTSPEMAAQEALWKLRNKMVLEANAIFATPGDSSLNAYLPDKELLKTHPEYFGKNPDGTPNPVMPNLTHPEVPKLVAAKVKAALEAQKKMTGKLPDSIGFSPDDGVPMDHGKETMALNQGFTDFTGREGVVTELSVSEEWFRFVNRVVEELTKDYPDLIFTTNGYANRHLPPEGAKLHPNLSVMYAPIWADTLKPFNAANSWHGTLHGRTLQRWCELNQRVWIYGYNYNMLVSCLTPCPTVRKIAHNIKQMRDWGVVGFADETRQAYMEHGITTYYVRARLEWNADLDVRATLDEFFTLWYGKAAKPSQAFWDALEERVQASPLLGHEDRILPYLYTGELVASLEKCIAEAERLADTDRTRLHVKVDRLILEHLKAYQAMHAAEFDGNFAEAVRQAEAMFEQRKGLTAISGFWNMPESTDPVQRLWSGTWYWNLTDRRQHYQTLADRVGGQTGDLVALAPRQPRFALDPADLGKFEKWYAADYDRGPWRTLDCTTPYYLQGYLNERGIPQHRGLMWYVFEVEVPASAAGKKVTLYAPVVIAEAWVWMNGKYLGRRNYLEAYIRPAPVEFDVTDAVIPGKKNVIAVRVGTGMNLTQAPDGFQGRLFLYTPKPGVKE